MNIDNGMKSVTVDNILWKYDRIYPYHTCQKKQNCPTLYLTSVWHPLTGCVQEMDCFCYSDCVLYPMASLIADIWVPPFPEIKQYIQIGEECPICYEMIYSRLDAYLTLCGHAFHRSCLFQSHQTAMLELGRDSFICPLCREQQPGPFGSPCRYKNEMANYEMFGHLYMPRVCMNYNYTTSTPCVKQEHIMGMNGACESCLNYRKTGQFW